MRTPNLTHVGMVRDSNEFVRRQILYMNKLELPEWFELLYVDHVSDPPMIDVIENGTTPNFNMRIVRCTDPRPWVISTLCNMAIVNAHRRTHLMFMGVDHMISQDFINWFGAFVDGKQDPKKLPHWATGPRQYALIDKDGNLEPIEEFAPRRPHQFVSRRCIKAIGGFDRNYDICGGEDIVMRDRYYDMCHGRRGRSELLGMEPPDFVKHKQWKIPMCGMVYMLPNKPDPRRPDHLLHKAGRYGECGTEYSKGFLVYDSKRQTDQS